MWHERGRRFCDQIKGYESDARTDDDVLRDVSPDVPRPTLSRDDPSVEPEEERPVPRNMKITQDILKKFGYTPGCAKCRKFWRNEFPIRTWHIHKIVASELRQRDPKYRDRVERAEQRKMDFYAKEVDQMDCARRASLEPGVVPRPRAAETEVQDRSSVQEAKRAREEPAQDLSGEIPIPSDDETLTKSGYPSCAMWCDSIQLNSSSSSGVKRKYSESTALPSVPGVTSGSDVKRACGESIALPNPPVVSSGSGLKRA